MPPSCWLWPWFHLYLELQNTLESIVRLLREAPEPGLLKIFGAGRSQKIFHSEQNLAPEPRVGHPCSVIHSFVLFNKRLKPITLTIN